MSMPRVILFDLYGTLLSFNQRPLIRALASRLGIAPRSVANQFKGRYLIEPFATPAQMITDLCLTLHQDIDDLTACACVAILEEHLAKVSCIEGAEQVLGFLKACGFELGLVSNAASPFKTPLHHLGLARYFDHVLFSCDVGACKPDPSIYLRALERFAAQPQECVFVGDAWRNDYLVPRAMGMQAVWVGKRNGAPANHVDQLHELAWYSFACMRPLLSTGDGLCFDGARYTLVHFETLSLQASGKYNIVAKAILVGMARATTRTLYIKRFSLPGSASLEKLAYKLYATLAATHCTADILELSEPLLATSEVRGMPWAEIHARTVAYQIGVHLALAYILAHTDIRPRNLILQPIRDGLQVELIDMEHCLFAAALDLEGWPDASTPAALSTLTRVEFLRRTKHDPLGLSTLRRVVTAFTRSYDTDAFEQFRRGWSAGFQKAEAKQSEIARILNQALQGPLCPVIGTRGYRRALTTIDIEQLLQRANEDPEKKLDEILGLRHSVFEYEYTVTMGDVNAMGNCYFLKYFELQGHVRELWFKQHVRDYQTVLDQHVLSTRSAHCDFKVPFFLYDTIVVRMRMHNLQRVSVSVLYEFYRKGSDQLHASGKQVLVCKDVARKTCRMPKVLSDAFRQFTQSAR
ncbi:HAD-IA family hydrolase [Pseudomonas oryziphila]|uniref:HAD family hydrolase n=1 Tax=Pseudomonas oryziphila TaxID=2894079 RepID=A0ABM7CT72_9PSED|nr:HAD-IA family hydrolase [Pseudomonas oryziphila]AZL74659.1 HAD family hydrolase [Pseudomonas oryziphila]